jgi:hypothetical protein
MLQVARDVKEQKDSCVTQPDINAVSSVIHFCASAMATFEVGVVVKWQLLQHFSASTSAAEAVIHFIS